jgi:simple sugar transport system ATP-binding protein
MTAPIVKMERISKAFGAVRALYLVDLSVERGEVLGLVGDNAAGKSTLMKILSGAYQPDGGAIEIEGAAVAFPGPHAARAFGIEMIYQDYALVPALTVTQNIFLGREILGRWPILRTLQQRRMDERAKALFATLGLRVPSVSSPVRELSGGQQQAVAIVREIGDNGRTDRQSRRARYRQGSGYDRAPQRQRCGGHPHKPSTRGCFCGRRQVRRHETRTRDSDAGRERHKFG